MKQLIFACAIVLAAAQSAFSQDPGLQQNKVPDELITNDSTFWTISTLSSISYQNTTPGANYGTYRSGGGMIVQFKFKKNGRFIFQLYVQANSYGMDQEAWTEVEGTVQFSKDHNGQNILVTKAEKGIYRIIRNGQTTSRPIPRADLEAQHSCTYLWERTMLRDDPNNIYLLMIDLEKYPDANVNQPGTIKPEWISRFHIPKK